MNSVRPAAIAGMFDYHNSKRSKQFHKEKEDQVERDNHGKQAREKTDLATRRSAVTDRLRMLDAR